MGNFVNVFNKYDIDPKFSKKYFNIDEHYFSIKQEYVASAGFWIARKRYAQLIISEKGVSISEMTKGEKEWKLDVKGMDVVRSDFPKAFRELFSDILTRILKLEPKKTLDNIIINLRENMKNIPLLDVMFPVGIKDLNKYVIKKKEGQIFGERAKGTPAHVKAALNHNDMIDYYGILAQPIMTGDKIKWTYLKQNSLKRESMAIKGYDDPEKIIDFIKEHIDYDHIFESKLENKLTDFYNALSYGALPVSNNLDDFFSFS